MLTSRIAFSSLLSKAPILESYIDINNGEATISETKDFYNLQLKSQAELLSITKLRLVEYVSRTSSVSFLKNLKSIDFSGIYTQCSLNNYDFSGLLELEEVNLDTSYIRVIPKGCFMNCYKLKTVYFNYQMYEIGEWAFASTALTGSITLQVGHNILSYAFYNTSITALELMLGLYDPDSENYNFSPFNFQETPRFQFANNPKLTSVKLTTGNKFDFSMFINCTSITTMEVTFPKVNIENNVVYFDGHETLVGCLPLFKETSFTVLPETMTINPYAFSLAPNLESVKMSHVIIPTNYMLAEAKKLKTFIWEMKETS